MNFTSTSRRTSYAIRRLNDGRNLTTSVHDMAHIPTFVAFKSPSQPFHANGITRFYIRSCGTTSAQMDFGSSEATTGLSFPSMLQARKYRCCICYEGVAIHTVYYRITVFQRNVIHLVHHVTCSLFCATRVRGLQQIPVAHIMTWEYASTIFRTNHMDSDVNIKVDSRDTQKSSNKIHILNTVVTT